MNSLFFENIMAEVLALAGFESPLSLRRCMANSYMLSSDVSAGYDPSFTGSFEIKNSAIMGHGLAFNKFTGRGGKVGSNDEAGVHPRPRVASLRPRPLQQHGCLAPPAAELGANGCPVAQKGQAMPQPAWEETHRVVRWG